MTPEQLRDKCLGKVQFIPHHRCAICDSQVGWIILKGPHEVFFDSSCECGESWPRQSNWDEILKWITDDEGNIREEYKYLID